MPRPISNNAQRSIAGLLLVGYVGVLAWESACHAPKINEMGHLAAGLAVWELGRFDLYEVNPPLVKSVAALPAFAAGAKTRWSRHRIGVGVRTEDVVGEDFFLANGRQAMRYLAWGRWCLIPFAILGALVCLWWGNDAYGRPCGLAAMTLWCISPGITTAGAAITADGAAAALGVAFGYSLWRWHRSPQWPNALVAGVLLGLAILSKFSWLVAVPVVPAAAALSVAKAWRLQRPRDLWRRAGQTCTVLAIGCYAVNSGYLFHGSFRRLGDYRFVSRALGGPNAADARYDFQGNRFADSWLGRVPVPLPEDLVRGIDLQKRDFDAKQWSLLAGTWKYGGWVYFYLAALALKEPLGILILVVWRALPVYRSLRASNVLEECISMLPGAALFALVSCETGFSVFARYALPAYPFLLIWTSRLFREFERSPAWRRWCLVGACLWAAIGAASVLPHSHGYFNELAGGPRGGPRWLHPANVEWGVDVLFLEQWCQEHPEARPLYAAFYTSVPRRFLAVPAQDMEYYGPGERPKPGWYAFRASFLNGPGPNKSDEWFRSREPDYVIADSIYVYRVE